MTDNPYEWREPGEPLWPENPSFSIDNLAKIRASSESDWQALYQGRPQPLTGDLFRRDQIGYWYPYKSRNIPRPVQVDKAHQPQPLIELPHFSDLGAYTMSCDLTFKGKEDSDYIALGVWVSAGAKEFLVDQFVGQKGFADTLKAIVYLLTKWPKISKVLIEDAANGPAIIETLKGHVGGVEARPTAGGKIARAHAISPRFASGDIYFPHPTIAPWVGSLVDELIKFPRGKHDDQVDQLTHYLAWRTENKSGLDRLLMLSQY